MMTRLRDVTAAFNERLDLSVSEQQSATASKVRLGNFFPTGDCAGGVGARGYESKGSEV